MLSIFLFGCWLLSGSALPPPIDSILSFLDFFGLLFSLYLVWAGGDSNLLGRGFQPSLVRVLGLNRIVSLGCALDLLCILDLWSSLSALCHGKRRRIHGIDLTGGIYNGSDSVGGVGGFPCALAPALDRASIRRAILPGIVNATKENCFVHMLFDLFPLHSLFSSCTLR